MLEQGVSPEYKEKYIGLTTLDCAKLVVAQNPHIHTLSFRAYFYIPNTESGDSEEAFRIPKDSFLQGDALNHRAQDLPERWNIAICSPVGLTDGSMRHLELLDLALSKSDENLQRTAQRLRQIIVPRFGGGFILETRKSYHFFGRRLLTPDQWLDFLGASLLTSIVTVTPDEDPNIHERVADYRYIGYSLLRRYTGLRITTNGDKTFVPRVVDVI
ncbi:MAG: hypothetical protein HY427_01780 [Candidatus Levybacteria bacterium]|nr:hypothetical protein [Candidatus Levybacteria bacterium]